MKIAIVHQPWNRAVPPVQEGSIAIWNYEVARRLARSHDVAAYARRCQGGRTELNREGVCYRRLSTFPDPYSRLGRSLARVSRVRNRTLPEFARPGYYAAFAARVSREVARHDADVIHVHNLSHFVPVLREHNPAARILLHMHCEWLTQLPPGVVRERIRLADGIVGCSGYIARGVAERYPELAGRTGTLHNGVDTTTFSPSTGSPPTRDEHGPVLLYVGRLSPEKGIHHLVDAFREVVRTYPDSTLRIVGPDAPTPREFLVALADDPVVRSLDVFYEASYTESLRDRSERECAGRVRFHGEVPHDWLPDIYRSADVLVNPSLSEAFGMSSIEASACAVPVVACNVGGIPEAVRDGETGLLVERGDVEGLTAAILRLLGDDDLRRTLGRRGVEWVSERFSWERIVEDTLARYETLGEG